MSPGFPWWFGGVEGQVQGWCYSVLALPLGIWFFDLFRKKENLPTVPAVLLLPFLALTLIYFQTVPLSQEWVQKLSPKAVELREQLSINSDSNVEAGIKPDSHSSETKKTLSLNPDSTKKGFYLLLLGLISFSLGARFFNESKATIVLCIFLALNGVVLSIFAIVQYLQWNGKIYWTFPVPPGSGAYGPFINRNNAGGYLNLCLGGAIGFIIYRLSQIRYTQSGLNNNEPVAYADPRSAGIRMYSYIKNMNLMTFISIVIGMFIVGGILCSRSRGAILAMGIGLFIMFLTLLRTKRYQIPVFLLGIPLLAGVLLVGWVGMSQDLQLRVSQLFNKEKILNTRLPNWLDGIKILPDFPVTGTGVGTYRRIYPLYQNRFDEDWYYHAENEYLELIVETGLPGLALLLLMVLVLFKYLKWVVGVSYEPRFYGVAIAMVFLMTSQLVNLIFDFGFHIPSNLILFSLLAGSLAGSVSMESASGSMKQVFTLGRSRTLNTMIASILLVACYLGFEAQKGIAKEEIALKESTLSKPLYEHPPENWKSVTEDLQEVIKTNQENADLYQALGYAYVRKFRSEAFHQFLENLPEKKEVPDSEKRNMWQSTSLVALHARAQRLLRDNKAEELEKLKKESIVSENLFPAIEAFQKSIEFCPMMNSSHLYLAKLAYLKPEEVDELKELESVAICSPSDPDVLFQTGLLHLAAGRDQQAKECWQKSLSLTSRHLREIRSIALRKFTGIDFVENILPGDLELLVGLIRNDFSKPKEAGIQVLLIEKVDALMKDPGISDAEKHYYEAVVHRVQGKFNDAENSYSEAIKLIPNQDEWMYEFAILLMEMDKLEEAERYARKCVWQKPNMNKYRKLLNRIEELNKPVSES